MRRRMAGEKREGGVEGGRGRRGKEGGEEGGRGRRRRKDGE